MKIKVMASLLVAQSLAFAIEIPDISSAINIAGKERMFTQRMLKDYAMVGMKNSFGDPKNDLTKSMEAFSDALNSLEKFAKDSAIKDAIKKQNEQWSKVKKDLSADGSKDKAKSLQVELDKLLKLSDDTTKLFAKASGKHSGEIINISGRQRMLSQRMASLYMMKVWGINDSEFKKKLSDAMTLFKTSHEKLSKYPKNTPEIKGLLKKVERSFKFFEFMSKSDKKFIPSLIYKKSNGILKNMNKATMLYTKIK